MKASSYTQAQAPEDDLRVLTEFIQKVGIDRLQAMLTTTSKENWAADSDDEVDEWGQNFD